MNFTGAAWLLSHLATSYYIANMLDLRIHCMVRTIDNLANNTKLPYHPGPFIALIDASPAKTIKDKTAHRDPPTDIKVPAIALKHPIYRIIASSHGHCEQLQGENQSSALGDPGGLLKGGKK